MTVNLSRNEIFLILLLYVRQIWKTHLTLATSLQKVIFIKFKGILLLICMILYVLQITWKRVFLLFRTVPLRTQIFSVLHLVSHFFFRRWSPPSSVHKVVDTALSNLDKGLSMNFSPVNFFSRLSRASQGPVTYSSRTGRPSEFC